jgi:hypothetical protein
MKKTIYTLSFVAMLALAGKSQTESQTNQRKPQPTKETVNPDGSSATPTGDRPQSEPQGKKAPAPQQPSRAAGKAPGQAADVPAPTPKPQKAPASQPSSADNNVDRPQDDPATKPKDRHAITEKGVPASKNKAPKEGKPTEEKKAPATNADGSTPH